MSDGTPLAAGVIGVGSMGRNHARVYDEVGSTTLAGVFDVDKERARTVAETFDTEALTLDVLLDRVDVASVTVPTSHHYVMARECLERGVDTLVEKPFVDDIEEGRELVDIASGTDAVLQVGHIERFNPAVRALRDVLPELDVISLQAERLGPPTERDIEDPAVRDLMIHDLDVVLDLLDGDLIGVEARGTEDGDYAVATLAFDDGVVGALTASRVTQERVRRLTISARTCRVKLDYVDQTVEVRRTPASGGGCAYDNEFVVEEVTVDEGEPLKNELRAFAAAAAGDRPPVVTGEEGLRTMEIVDEVAHTIESTPPCPDRSVAARTG